MNKIVKSRNLREDDILDDELAHFGVLGMKWGVRKDKNLNGSLNKPSIKNKAHETSAKKAKRQFAKALAKLGATYVVTLLSMNYALDDGFREGVNDLVGKYAKKILSHIVKEPAIKVTNNLGKIILDGVEYYETISTPMLSATKLLKGG